MSKTSRWCSYCSQWLLNMVMMLLVTASLAMAQTADTTPPELVSFNFVPSTIDLSGGPQSVTVNLQLTDDLSGVPYGANVQFVSPSFKYFNAFATFTSGDALNGTYVGSIEFSPFVENGIWTVGSIYVADVVGNRVFIDTATLASRGFPTQLTVVNSTPDTEPPMVSDLSFDPSALDVSTAPMSTTVQLGTTDNVSGVVLGSFGSGDCFPMRFVSPSGAQDQYLSQVDFSLVNGTPQDGAWQATLTLPQFSEAGFWQLQNLKLEDYARNDVWLFPLDLATLGLPTGLNVVSSSTDTTPPTLQSLDFAPRVINTSVGNQVVTVTMHVTDDIAGVEFSPTTSSCSYFEAGISFRSPSDQQQREAAYFSPVQLISGTPQDGMWEATIYFPQFSEEGTWRIDRAEVKDVTRNRIVFDTAALRTNGFPTDLVVARPSLIGDGIIDDPAAGGAIMDQVFGDRAQVIFPPGVLSNPTEVAIDVFSDPLDIPNPAGFQGPGTHFVNIELTPLPTFPLPPPGLTVVLPLPNPEIAGAHLALYRVDPTTGNLVPSLDVVGAPVIGTVDPGGLSATFMGIAHLSIVVGLVPAVPGDLNGDGDVDRDDLNVLLARRNTPATGPDDPADLDGDGMITTLDARILVTLCTRERCAVE